MKEIKIGYIIHGHRGRGNPISDPVFIEIEETDTGFNLTGRIRNHSYGQIDDTVRAAIQEQKFEFLIPEEDVRHVLDYWDKWHLSDLRPGCPHQTEFLKQLRVRRPTLFEKYDYMAIKGELVDAGLSPCHICAYEYGHGWKTEIAPPSELAWIRAFKQKWEGVELGRRIKSPG